MRLHILSLTSFFPLIALQPPQHYSSSAPGPSTASSTSPSTPPLPTDDCQCPPHVMAQVWVRNGRGMQDSKSLDEISQACGGQAEVQFQFALVLAPIHLQKSDFKCFHVSHSWCWGPGRRQRRPAGGPTGHNLFRPGAGRDGQS